MNESFTFPNQDEMYRRLTKLGRMPSHVKNNLYPILIKQAGRELSIPSLVMVLVFAVDEYMGAMSSSFRGVMYCLLIPRLIDVLVGNEGLTKEAIDFFESTSL